MGRSEKKEVTKKKQKKKDLTEEQRDWIKYLEY
jgi:hypothetical protein